MRKYLLLTVLVSVSSLLLFWSPYIFKSSKLWGIEFGPSDKSFHPGISTIVQNFDGINFLVVAKSWYNPILIRQNFAEILDFREELYFSAHYPLFPIVISVFDMLTSGPNALILAILFSNIVLAATLFIFFSEILPEKREKIAFILSCVSLFFPPRILSDRVVGSNEPLFISLVLLSLVMSSKGKHLWAAILGSLAVLTRSPGILLFAAYFLSVIATKEQVLKDKLKLIAMYSLIPLTLLALWAFYGIRFGSFFSYFQVGGNINLVFPAFMVFADNQKWVSGLWLEDILFTFTYISLGVLQLKSVLKDNLGRYSTVLFGGIYLLTTFFIVHRDIARYSLPIAPIALAGLYPFLLNAKNLKYLGLLIVPLYLLAWHFVNHNLQPISDWTNLL